MSPDALKRFETMLLAELSRLRAHNDPAIVAQVLEVEAAADPLDQAHIEEGREKALRLAGRDAHQAHEVDLALLRLRSGAFGICERCDDDIPEPRLLARPATRLCLRCKSSEERKVKRTG